MQPSTEQPKSIGSAAAMPATDRDALTRTVTFLQKRDGIDKVLKIVRYAVKLACVSTLKDSDTELAAQLRGFEASIGVTR